jgi:replicative DNA helicase
MSVINRFDIRAIGAGVMRLISNPALLEKYHKFLFPMREYIFYNDEGERPKNLRLIIKELQQYFQNKGTKDLTFQAFESYFALDIKKMNTEEQKQYHKFYTEIKNDTARINDDGVFSNFLDYLKILQIAKFSQDVVGPYNKGEPDKAVEEMNRVISNIAQISASNYYDFDPTKIMEKLKENKGWNQQVLNLGGLIFDQRLGGFKPKTLNLFVGLTNSGKSQMAYHLLRRCVEHKFHVHITIVEDTEETFIERIVACLTGLDISIIKNPLIWTNEHEKLILKAQDDITEYITADFVYGQSIDFIHKRKQEVDLKRKMENLPPIKVDIVDYTAHVSGKSWGDKKFDKMLTAYTARKDFALETGKIVFDFAQVNRDGSKKSNSDDGILTISELAGSFDISHVCDTIISINRSEKDIRSQQIRLHICKSRNGEKGGVFTYKVDFAKARCLIGSQYQELAEFGDKKAQAEAAYANVLDLRKKSEGEFNEQ